MKYRGDYAAGRFFLPKGRYYKMTSIDPGNLEDQVGDWKFSTDALGAIVSFAGEAFKSWSKTTLLTRIRILKQFGRHLKSRRRELATCISREMGKPYAESIGEVDRLLARIPISIDIEPEIIRSKTHLLPNGSKGSLEYEPRGIIAVLAPFNVPAYLGTYQIMSALMTGNVVVFKPSEITPFTGQLLAETWHAADLPKGVFNMIQGDGRAGKCLVEHPDINAVFFTGSWNTGSKIQTSLLTQPNKVSALEMGGKNSAIVLKDANLNKTIESVVTGTFLTSGQRCNATSRILVEEKIMDKFLEHFLPATQNLKVGYFSEKGVNLGPLVSRQSLLRFEAFLRQARKERFEPLLTGGRLKKSQQGFYRLPSVHLFRGNLRDPIRKGSYRDEEVFGPDAAIYIVKNLDEAIWLNNRSQYGLVVSLFSRSKKAFQAVKARCQNGVINWNLPTVASSAQLPFGGMKQSGNNRPAGIFMPHLCTRPVASVQREK